MISNCVRCGGITNSTYICVTCGHDNNPYQGQYGTGQYTFGFNTSKYNDAYDLGLEYMHDVMEDRSFEGFMEWLVSKAKNNNV